MKKTKIIFSILCVVVFLLLAIGSTGSDDEPRIVEDAAPKEVIEQDKSQDEDLDIDEDILVELALNLMKSNFTELAEISVDKVDKFFIITPTDETLIEAFTYVALGNKEVLESYESYIESQKELSIAIAELLPEYSLATANPKNTELFLLLVWNGVVIYNYTDDL